MRFDLRSARLNAGLSQSQLAEQVGLSRDTIARLEAGDGLPFPSNAKKIADYFDVKVTDLFPVKDPV